MARRSKGGRTKDGRILVRIGEDSRKRLARNAALEKSASDRAIRKEAKKAATRLRRSQREIAKRAMQLARRLARERARDARRAAKRAGNNKPTEEYNRQREENARKKREENARKKRKKRPFHPRGPYATERYTSYARRLERSEKLTANVINETTASVGRWIIKTTTGGIPLSCNCPDFTQIDGSRSWKGSSAGPFNPCKHMIAVQKGKWKCENGVCVKSKFGLYNTKAECEAALIPPAFIGGQCLVPYYITVTWNSNAGFGFGGVKYAVMTGQNLAGSGTPPSPGGNEIQGKILGSSYTFNSSSGILSFTVIRTGGTSTINFLVSAMAGATLFSANIFAVYRVDGNPDNCGNLPSTCP